MVTEHSNTVYNCGSCGRPIGYRHGTGWRHTDRSPACHTDPVSINLPLPTVRVTA